MSANGDAARRDMWAGHIERCLAADMTVKERYALNKVAEFSLCKWMACFREEDLDRFPCRLSESSSWMKVTRRGIADAMAIITALGGAANPFSAPDAGERGTEVRSLRCWVLVRVGCARSRRR